MTVATALDAAGRRRSPATMPGYHAGRPPRNKGMRYPADPPTVDEIVAVMRHIADDRHGWRLRAMIVVLWRAGLRIHEALALTEHDLDPRRGSVLVRSGKGGRRREIGMDEWGWEQVRPWLSGRVQLPVGPLFCIIDGPTRGRPWSSAAVRREFRLLAVGAGYGVGSLPISCVTRTRSSSPAGRAAEHHPVPARAFKLLHDQHLFTRDRSRGDPDRGARTPRADDVGQRRTATLGARRSAGGSAPGAPALPIRKQASTQAPLRQAPVVQGGRLAGHN
jgi:Phage integrase family